MRALEEKRFRLVVNHCRQRGRTIVGGFDPVQYLHVRDNVGRFALGTSSMLFHRFSFRGAKCRRTANMPNSLFLEPGARHAVSFLRSIEVDRQQESIRRSSRGVGLSASTKLPKTHLPMNVQVRLQPVRWPRYTIQIARTFPGIPTTTRVPWADA